MLCSAGVRADWSIDLEGGLASNGYNDVQIPGNTGTRFSLSEELDSDPVPFGRLRITRDLGEKHQLSLLIAPLRLESSGSLDRDLDYNGEQFDAGTRLETRYRFDSYRLTWRWKFHNGQTFDAAFGVTAKIRDAAITVTGGGKTSEKANTGPVPLLHLKLDWQFSQRLGLLLEGDGLAAPQGRAEDFLLALTGKLSHNVRLKTGYRILEGGADNDEVYNFTLVHYGVIGLSLQF
jgi:hypothetical protein